MIDPVYTRFVSDSNRTKFALYLVKHSGGIREGFFFFSIFLNINKKK